MKCDIDFTKIGFQSGYFHTRATRNDSAYGRISIPICSYKAPVEGPTVLLTAGFHGDEYEGQILLRNIINLIEEQEIRPVKGRIIIVPSLNLPASQAATRFSPTDAGGKEKVSVGQVDGLSQLINRYLEDELMALADVCLDLHSGGSSLDYIPLAISFIGQDDNLNERNANILSVFNAPFSMLRDARDIPCAAFEAAARKNCTYLATELGGTTRILEENIRVGYAGIMSVLENMQIISNDKRPNFESKWIEVNTDEDHIYAEEDGIFYTDQPLGKQVEENQEIGQIHKIDRIGKNSIVPVFSQSSGVILAKRALAKCRRGDCLFEVGHIINKPDILSLPR